MGGHIDEGMTFGYQRRSTYEALISVLGISEETAEEFTAQTASDIADRSVELYQILERLARDGDAICQALEAQTLAQGDISSGRNSVRLLKIILPHIKAYFTGRVGQGLLQDGEVSSTESIPASNGNTASLPSHHLPNSQDSSRESMLSISAHHVPSTQERPVVAISNAVATCSSETSHHQSIQPALGKERGAVTLTESSAASSAVKASRDYFSQSLLTAASLGDRSKVVAPITVSQAASPVTQMAPAVIVPIVLPQSSVLTSNKTEMAPTTLAAGRGTVKSIVVHTSQSQLTAVPYSPHMTFSSSHASVRMASVNQPNVARNPAEPFLQSQLRTQPLSHADLPQVAVGNTNQAFSSTLRWLSNRMPLRSQLLGQYYPPRNNATSSHFPQSAMNPFHGLYSANPFQLPPQQPQGGQLPRTVTVQTPPPRPSSKGATQAVPVMPSVMTPALYPSRREERRPFSPPYCTAFPSLLAGQQPATQGLVHPHQGLPLPLMQHHTAVAEHVYQSTQTGGQHLLGAMHTSRPLFQPLSGSFQRKAVDLTPNPQSLTICNHPHISVRQAPPAISPQPSSCDPTTAVVTTPLMTGRVTSSQGVTELLAHSNHSKEVESRPLRIDTPVEPSEKVAGGSVEQNAERCSVMRDCEQKHAPHPQCVEPSPLLPVEDLPKSQHATKEAPDSPKPLGVSTNDPFKDSGCDAVVVSSAACPSSSEYKPTLSSEHKPTLSSERHPTFGVRTGDNTGVETLSLVVQDPVASAAEVEVLATGSVQSLPHPHPVEVAQSVPTSTPSCRGLGTLSPTTDATVHPAMGPIVGDRAMELAEPPLQTPSVAINPSVDQPVNHLMVPIFHHPTGPTAHPPTDATIQPPRDPTSQTSMAPTVHSLMDTSICSPADPAVQPPADATAHPPVDATIHSPTDPTIQPPSDPTVHTPRDQTTQPPMDTTIHSATDQTTQPPMDTTIHSATDSTIQPSVDTTIHLQRNATIHPRRGQTTHPPTDPTVDFPTEAIDRSPVVPAVHPPMEQTTHQQSIKANISERTVLNERLSFATLIKQHAVVHLTVLAGLATIKSARSATQKKRTATWYMPPCSSSSGMSRGAESLEMTTAGSFPTNLDAAVFESATSEDSRMLGRPSFQPSQYKTATHAESSQSAKGTRALDVGSAKGKGKRTRLKGHHHPSPPSRTPSRKPSQQERVPPLMVGTTALVKFGVGEKANWREGVITEIGSNGRKSRAPVCIVKTEGRPCGLRKELHQLAVVEPAKENNLCIKDVVVGWYGDLGTRFSGVVAETPVKENGYRALVFFYDGFAQYLSPSRLHLCYQWNKIAPDRNYKTIKIFFKEYFSQYPQRLMLRLRKGDTVQLERFQDVLEAQVDQVDCSLVKLQFTARGGSGEERKYEWVYRGSTRLMPLCEEVIRRKGRGGRVPNGPFTFTDDLFDPECPPSTTPPDNTGVLYYGQTPGKKPLPLGGVDRMAVSELQRRSSELHVHLSSSTSTAAQADTNVGGLPTPPSAQQLVKEVLPPFRRKRAASGDGASSTKKTRTLSASSMGTTVAAMSSEDFDSDDSVFENRPLARCAKKSKPRQVLSSSEDHPPHRHHQQGQPLPTEAASTSHSAQETEENDTTYSRESLTNYFPVPEFDHRCGPLCKGDTVLPSNYLLHHSLTFPLMLKWRRCKQVYCKGNRQTPASHLYYVAPCGIRLKTLNEVEDQLCVMEEDRLTVDMFCFDDAISVNFKPMERPRTALFYNGDLSGGLEMVPLSCVNELDTEAPPPFEYTLLRRCGPGVELGHTRDFLLSCSCDGGHCAKEGCPCNKLSVEEAQRTRTHDLMHPLHVADVSYTHRRLLTERTAAIFECNDGCQCSNSCGNRVVQSKMRPRLQVFKTKDRGWGVRCLDDIPKGTFTAHYSGIILTDKDADEAALVRTDAYLVDLDYIEVMENQKGSIESDPVTGTSNTSSAMATPPSLSFDSHTTPDHLDHTWVGSSPAEEMEDEGSAVHQNEETSTRRGTHANSDKPKETASENISSSQSELACSSKSANHVKRSPPISAYQAISPSSDDGDLPLCNLVNMTSRHPSASNTTSLPDNSKGSSPSTAVKAEQVPTVKQEDCSFPLGGLGEEVLRRRRHVGTGARRATGTSYEDPICLSDSESDGDSSESGSNSSTPSSGSSPPTGGSPLSATVLEQLPVPDSSLSNDTRVSQQRQVFGEQQVFVIDASRVGNVARFFNHSCQPNLFVQNVFVDNHDIRLPWVALFAQVNIKAMTELTWDYNYVPGSVPNRELVCKCGAPECRGRLL